MNCVDHSTATAFCAWDTDGGRLPTEAQWEFAARGVLNRPWPWGGPDSATPDGRACWNRFSPMQLGTCLEDDLAFAGGATPDGVWHLVGNVWEWTADCYAHFNDPSCWGGLGRTNPVCVNCAFHSRSVRGGAWDGNLASDIRLGVLYGYAPGDRYSYVGFRCASPAR